MSTFIISAVIAAVVILIIIKLAKDKKERQNFMRLRLYKLSRLFNMS